MSVCDCRVDAGSDHLRARAARKEASGGTEAVDQDRGIKRRCTAVQLRPHPGRRAGFLGARHERSG